MNGTNLLVVSEFVYISSMLTRDGSVDSKIFLKSSDAFEKLEKITLADQGITKKKKKNTKVSIYRACILTALLYSLET